MSVFFRTLGMVSLSGAYIWLVHGSIRFGNRNAMSPNALHATVRRQSAMARRRTSPPIVVVERPGGRDTYMIRLARMPELDAFFRIVNSSCRCWSQNADDVHMILQSASDADICRS